MSEINVQLHPPHLNCADPYPMDFGGARIHRRGEQPTLMRPSGYNSDVSEYQRLDASWNTDFGRRSCSKPRWNYCADVLAPYPYQGDKKSYQLPPAIPVQVSPTPALGFRIRFIGAASRTAAGLLEEVYVLQHCAFDSAHWPAGIGVAGGGG